MQNSWFVLLWLRGCHLSGRHTFETCNETIYSSNLYVLSGVQLRYAVHETFSTLTVRSLSLQCILFCLHTTISDWIIVHVSMALYYICLLFATRKRNYQRLFIVDRVLFILYCFLSFLCLFLMNRCSFVIITIWSNVDSRFL